MKVSVIIPTLNEENLIGPLVTHLLQQSAGFLQEVIVVDGGSQDQTVQRAQEAGAEVLACSPPGRARQMNVGAHVASGHILHFIHADSWPPAGFDVAVVKAVTAGKQCGCFRSRFQTQNRFLLLNSYFTRFPGLVFRGGGQTLFTERKLFQNLNGYKEHLQVMEEYDLIRRLSRKSKFQVLPQEVLVSARRYEQNGTLRLQMAYGLVMLLFFLGASQQKLMKVYRALVT
jgi:rSAM/selenodomain-associated transferase 2